MVLLVVVVSAALNEGLVTLNDNFDCERGNWRYMGRDLHDHGGGYGVISVENIITKSSNIGSAKIAVYKLGPQKLYDYIRAFGFGEKTGIPLGGETAGRVIPLPDWSKDKLLISRIPISIRTMPTPFRRARDRKASSTTSRSSRVR